MRKRGWTGDKIENPKCYQTSVHDKLKRYRCDSCGYSDTSERNISTHKKFAHDETENHESSGIPVSKPPLHSDGRLPSNNVNKVEVEISPICAWCVNLSIDTVNHHLKECPKFADSSGEEKSDFVWKKKLCYGCLSPNHVIRNCEDRPRNCSKCRWRHIDLIPCGVSSTSPALVPQPGSGLKKLIICASSGSTSGVVPSVPRIAQPGSRSSQEFKCGLCQHISRSYQGLGIHIQNLHNISPHLIEDMFGRQGRVTQSPRVAQPGSGSPQEFRCGLCQYICRSHRGLGNHMQKLHHISPHQLESMFRTF